MPNPATHEVEEAAPPPFVNGEAPHGPEVAAPAKARVAPKRVTSRHEPRGDDLDPDAGDEGLAVWFRLHGEWQERAAQLAHQQLGYLSETGREFLAAAEAVAAEPDLARRADLLRAYGLRQLERSCDFAARCAEALGGANAPPSASSVQSHRPG